MKLIVGYLATSGGADAMALAVRLARTIGAEIEACIVLPPDRSVPALVPTGGYDEFWPSRPRNGWPKRRRQYPMTLSRAVT